MDEAVQVGLWGGWVGVASMKRFRCVVWHMAGGVQQGDRHTVANDGGGASSEGGRPRLPACLPASRALRLPPPRLRPAAAVPLRLAHCPAPLTPLSQVLVGQLWAAYFSIGSLQAHQQQLQAQLHTAMQQAALGGGAAAAAVAAAAPAAAAAGPAAAPALAASSADTSSVTMSDWEPEVCGWVHVGTRGRSLENRCVGVALWLFGWLGGSAVCSGVPGGRVLGV